MKRLTAKLVFMGSQGVGKSSIITRYIKGDYRKECEATIGASFMYAKVTIRDYTITLKVWDTAGQERFRSLVPMYYRNSDAIAVVFDVSDRESFRQVKSWINEVKKNTDTPVVYYVVGNKTDLVDSRIITYEEAKEFATSVDAHYWETSVYSNSGIQDLFTNIGRNLIEMVESSKRPTNIKLEIDPEEGPNNVKINNSNIKCCTN
ncbi:ras-related protein Rab5-like [Sipha flava]|uniref:Ras-related protein Rab5 n=1 Tax=Sipha flava TaxID=143950 RepID=A0A2S2Q3Y3_9HEMI|nr:ras-related protein Rab5-like [Sipha flava]XP_025412194.1 ras-related protein Rab5-like [Sipha flava]XP_025412195.1 ras-related protein Rab5-like [Sipha flava]